MGPSRGPAEQLAWTLGVSKYVDFLGKQNHVERLIRLAHVLLMPSEMESFGLASLEGMACGVPAVATRVGGVPQLITDGVDGFLGAVGDIAGLAKRATELGGRFGAPRENGSGGARDSGHALQHGRKLFRNTRPITKMYCK